MPLGCKPLSESEVSGILSSMPSARDKCLFLLGVKTGFRISELLSIRMDQLFELDGSFKDSINVERKNMKGKLASRHIPLSSGLIEVLKQYTNTLPNQQQYLFESQKGNKLSRIQAWRVIKDASKLAGIKGKVGTHSARKSYAKKIYEASGKDLVLTQKALGHSSVNSTISYLNSFTNEDLFNLIKKCQE